MCVGMVNTMASAYNGLTEEERERVFFLAVGKNDFKKYDSNFCGGFAACADDTDDPWWEALGAEQRDVFFYIKDNGDTWNYYCRYSMNTNRDEFDDTIREMLVTVDANKPTIEPNGNETMVEEMEDGIPMPVMSSSVKVKSSSHYPSKYNIMPSLAVSFAILGFFVI